MTKKKSGFKNARSKAISDEELLFKIMRENDAKNNGESSEKDEGGESFRTTDSFVNYEQNMGIGADNPLTTATYGFNPITRQRTVLEWMYRGSWLAGKLIDTIAEDMTRTGAEFLGEIEPKDAARATKWLTKNRVWHQISDAIKWGRLYGGGLLVILIADQKMSDPLNFDVPINPGEFKGVIALDRWMVEPDVMNLVTELGPDLGKPKWYRLNSMAPIMVGQKIHHTRVIRFLGVQLPYWQAVMENLWGESVLERVYDRLTAFDSATTGAAQLVYKSYLRNYKIKGFREIQTGSSTAMAGLINQINMMRRFQNSEGMTLMDLEDELVTDTHGAFGGLSDILIRFMEQVSGSEQIPLVRLFGQSPAGFSTGDTDLRNYYDSIDLRRENELRTDVSNIYKLTLYNLGIEIPDDFDIAFGSLWQLTDVEKADLSNKVVDSVSKAVESGLITPYTAMKELKQSSKKSGIFTNITDEDLEKARLQPPPMLELGEYPNERMDNYQGLPAYNSNGFVGNEPIDNRKLSGKERNGAGEGKSIQSSQLKSEKVKPLNKVGDSAMPVAAGILLTSKDWLLLCKRADNGLWAFPGGKIEKGEIAIQAAEREFEEETGLKMELDNSEVQCTINGFVGFICELPPKFLPSLFPDIQLNEENIEYNWFAWNYIRSGTETLQILPDCLEILKDVSENIYGVKF